MSGVCVAYFTGVDVRAVSQEVSFDKLLQWSFWAMDKQQRLDLVVVERFIITAQTVKKTFQPWALEGTGIVRAVALERDVVFTQQTAADAKSAVDNDKLRRLGIWHRGGAGHANDALRHAVLAAVARGWRHPALKS